MELPHFLHHPPRYVPPTHHPPPPPPPNFSDDGGGGGFYSHHLPPPPPPPPPIPQSYRPLPPPPPYNPPQSQFTYLNNRHRVEDDQRQPHISEFSRHQELQSRVSDRFQFDDYRPRVNMPEFDDSFHSSIADSSTDRIRLFPESRLARPDPPAFDREQSYHHLRFNDQIQLSSPNRTSDRYRQDVDSTSRFKKDSRGRIVISGDDVTFGQYRGVPSRSLGFDESRVVSSPNRSKRLASNVQDYGCSYESTPDSGRFSNDRYENWRWGHGEPTSRGLPTSQNEMENNDPDKDAIRASSGRGVPPDSGKFGNKRNRVVTQVTVQPQKKVQKKSALLRLQPPKTFNRNRNAEQHVQNHPLGFFDNSHPSSPFRDEENREASPVELDVSFKSNSLVAKPIVSPSSKAVVFDRNLTHRNRNTRKVALQGKVEDSGCGAICDTRSEPCPSGTSQSPGNRKMKTMVSGVGGNYAVSSGKLSFSARKKKKIPTPSSGASTLQLKEKFRDPVIADGLKGFRCAASSNESSQATVLENNRTNADSGRSSKPLLRGKRIGETIVGLSSPLRSKIVDGIVNANNSVHDSHPVSDFDKTELRNDSSFSEVGKVGDFTQRSYCNKTPKLLQNFVADGSSEVAAFGASNADADLSAEEIKNNEGSLKVNISIYKGFPDSISSAADSATIDLPTAEEIKIHNKTVIADGSNQDASTCSDKGFTDCQETITPSEFGFEDDGSKQSCADGVIVLHKNGPVHIPSLVKLPIGGNPSVGLDVEAISMIKRKRDVNNTQSVLSNAMTEDTSPKSPSTGNILTNGVRSIHPVKDFISADMEIVVSGDGGITACLQPCEDNRGTKVGPKGTSPRSRKKRKVCATDSSSLMRSGTHTTGMQLENGVAVSSSDTVSSVGLPSCSIGVSGLLENTVTGGSLEAVGFTGNVLELENETRPPGSGGGPVENSSLVMATADYERDTVEMESVSRKEVVRASSRANVDGMLHMEICKHGINLETQPPELDLGLPAADVKCKIHSVSDIHTLCAVDEDDFTTNFSDSQLESMPDTLSNMGSPETLSFDSGTHVSDAKLSLGHTSNEKVNEDDRIDENHAADGASVFFSPNKLKQDTNMNIESEHEVGKDLSKFSKTLGFSSKDTKKLDTKRSIERLHTMDGESKVAKNQRSSTVPTVSLGHSSSHSIPSKMTTASNRTVKSRTWRRTDNLPAPPIPGKSFHSSHVLPQRQSMGKSETVQHTSYIRKGNSLLRKPSPVGSVPHSSHVMGSSVHRLNPLDVDQTRKNIGFQSRVDATETLSCLRPRGYNVVVERPRTPPLHHTSKLSNFITSPLGELTSSQSAAPSSNGCSESTSDFPKLTDNMDVGKRSEDAPKFSGTPENQIALTKNFGIQNVQDEVNMATEKMRITYIKKKSNQLVATSSSNDLSVQDVEKAHALSSGAYFKRRKNQLIRKTSDSHIKERAVVPDDFMNSDGQRSSKVTAGGSFRERQSGKGLAKTYKHSKFSRVWTLCEALSSKKDSHIQRQMVRPQLFPWKRTTYRKTYMRNPTCIFNISSLSNISKKLLSFRKRDTIYTRSGRGYSLRRSKVLSVGGSSLKWSKSIERNSKKANEEATLAVAAAEKMKKEQQNNAAFIISGMKNRNNSSRERIFRIGSVRYKMDPTRRTLQRISEEEEESSCSAALESGEDVKKSYVPKRLVIGDDAYIRIGNGNKLVRDPKRRTRILASERVRWSLHTARLRIARKSKYCQFFTRFGKCNKDGGKCPYIHDSSKIAVCTKFLSGACSNPNCKLTHEIIPERMQDCSYFLQGICSNESCPYRHVNVNRNASICEGFLRGYCADGNECRKKHSYVCPIFEETGKCSQGSKCKLHHPKNRAGKKRRRRSSSSSRAGEQQQQKKKKNNNTHQGRYFDISSSSRSTLVVSEEQEQQQQEDNEVNDICLADGRLPDYISLDFVVSDGETNTFCDEDPLNEDEQVEEEEEDIDDDDEEEDELIKPVKIMKNRNSSLVVESSSSPAAIDRSSSSASYYISEEESLCCK